MVLHFALVLHHLGSGSQNEGGGGVHNAGNQIKVALAVDALKFLDTFIEKSWWRASAFRKSFEKLHK